MIVVVGATGNVGRPLVAELAAAGEQVVALSRNVTAGEVPDGVRPVRADLADFAGLGPVLKGADALFLMLAPELNAPGAPAAELLEVVASAGVRRVVLLSSLITATRPAERWHGRMGEFEAAVRGSGLRWTVLRPGPFASNTFAWAESVRARRTVFAPFGGIAMPVLDPADVASVAAAALRTGEVRGGVADEHVGRVYALTGPEAVTPRRQAELLGELLGEKVEFVEHTREQARAHLVRFMPPQVADGTLEVLGAPLPEESAVRPDVERVLGRPARTFADWAAGALPVFR
ncbi:NAD(P)H-binding protein [Kitasatospora sp. NPDC001540]|uniref:NAD(P)H-binding protein n=1 Tax=Kitasatospora sp. NPDC001540 TaxID=3364014 RepID=UPI003681E0AA